MKILFVAAEGAPFSKTGGLGDVIGALPKSLVKAGHEVAVILPYYDMVEAKFGDQIEDVLQFEVYVGWRRQFCGIKKTVLNGVTFYFIDNQYYLCMVISMMVNVLPSSNLRLWRLWSVLDLFLMFFMLMIIIQL